MVGSQHPDRIGDGLVTPRSDDRLQASRRLDWRFLLPEPALDRVLYFGPSSSPLAESLQSFSSSLTVAGASPVESGAFTVVVACNPSRETLGRAADALGAGGALYVELDRRTAAMRFARKLAPGAVRADIARLGVRSTSLAWHWPDFDSCTRIVPLDRHAALARAMQTGVRGATMRTFASALVRPRLVARWARSLSIVAQR